MFLYKITPQSINKYEQKSVYFAKPRLVAYYDYNYGKITNAKRINYFINPKSNLYPIDLNVGFETYIRRKSEMFSEYVEISLKYMSSTAECDGVKSINKTKVITRRGSLVRIMQLFYKNKFGDLVIRISRFKNNLYMVMEESDDSLLELTPTKIHHENLKNVLLGDSPDKSTNINEPCDENIKLVGVHRSTFGKYDIIYSGEIQGIISNNKFEDFEDLGALNDCRFVLIKQMWKTLKHNDNHYLKFWLQSYLANVQDVYIGYKNQFGIIEEPIEHIFAADLPKNRFWKPSICAGFLYEFLENVEKLMSDVNCLNTVYVFSYNRYEKSFSYKMFEGENDKTFISKEYMEYCKEK